jgi:hypothetical protein
MPKKTTVHFVVDNYAAHKHPKVLDGSANIRADPFHPDIRAIANRF